jgi:hypothetical protein
MNLQCGRRLRLCWPGTHVTGLRPGCRDDEAQAVVLSRLISVGTQDQLVGSRKAPSLRDGGDVDESGARHFIQGGCEDYDNNGRV